jgi:hypothetical protein
VQTTVRSLDVDPRLWNETTVHEECGVSTDCVSTLVGRYAVGTTVSCYYRMTASGGVDLFSPLGYDPSFETWALAMVGVSSGLIVLPWLAWLWSLVDWRSCRSLFGVLHAQPTKVIHLQTIHAV